MPAAGNQSTCEVANVGEQRCYFYAITFCILEEVWTSGGRALWLLNILCSTPFVHHHALAAAEDMGVVNDDITWITITSGAGLNLSTLISKEVPKAADKKARRKGVPTGKKRSLSLKLKEFPVHILTLHHLLLHVRVILQALSVHHHLFTIQFYHWIHN